MSIVVGGGCKDGGGSLETMSEKAPDGNRKIDLFALVWLLSAIVGVWPSYASRSSLWEGFDASTTKPRSFFLSIFRMTMLLDHLMGSIL